MVPAVTSETEITQLANGMHYWPDVTIKIIIRKEQKQIIILIVIVTRRYGNHFSFIANNRIASSPINLDF